MISRQAAEQKSLVDSRLNRLVKLFNFEQSNNSKNTSNSPSPRFNRVDKGDHFKAPLSTTNKTSFSHLHEITDQINIVSNPGSVRASSNEGLLVDQFRSSSNNSVVLPKINKSHLYKMTAVKKLKSRKIGAINSHSMTSFRYSKRNQYPDLNLYSPKPMPVIQIQQFDDCGV